MFKRSRGGSGKRRAFVLLRRSTLHNHGARRVGATTATATAVWKPTDEDMAPM